MACLPSSNGHVVTSSYLTTLEISGLTSHYSSLQNQLQINAIVHVVVKAVGSFDNTLCYMVMLDI